MIRLLIILIIPINCFSSDLFGSNPLNEMPPLEQESPEVIRQRAINMAQRAMFAYPVPRRIRKKIEEKFDALVGKEFAATIGAFYIAINKQEVSSRYINRLTVGGMGGTFRPDFGYQIREKNSYIGLFYFRGFP